MSEKMFDFCIGNPPYQDNQEATSDDPVYHYFMNAAYSVSDKAEFITPARFLFDAGKTPKEWNRKMLNDEHFKILNYEEKSSTIFPNTKIRGGVCISYRDSNKKFGSIKAYSPFSLMNSVLKKVLLSQNFNENLSSIMYLQNRFDLDSLYNDHPEYKKIIGSNGKERRFDTGIFDKISLFVDTPNYEDSVKIYGVVNKKRLFKYFPAKYMDKKQPNFKKYKVAIMKSNGEGIFGETLAAADVLEPDTGYTQSFIGIGSFQTCQEAERCVKYLKTKFCRALLDTKKVTQDNPPDTWTCVPLQDFTSKSDIDWSKSIPEIDQQLYQKYNLSPEEIDFIEKNVKEMA